MSKIYQKKVSVGQFLKKGDDFKDGDLLEVANEGKEVQGDFGMQNLFLMKINDKEGNVNFNQTTLNGMIDAFGKEAINWVGKKVKAWKVKQNVAGKFVDVWYFSHPDAELTEDGFVIEGKIKEEDIPVIGEEIDDKSIPF